MNTLLLKSLLFPTLLVSMVATNTTAKEGMRQPNKLKEYEAEMKKLGLSIPVNDLYNEEGSGLNNAVVLFGGGCTGEFVSSKGLIFTNHHCAYGNVQALSTATNNYLENGFFAQSTAQEIPCPGLTVQIVRKLHNVTSFILKNIEDSLPEDQRVALINERIKDLEKAYSKLHNIEAQIKAYYEGNEYWITLKDTYKDVRLVAFPPNGIGKFGADTDNWMWPRHTGDFAVLRVYADQQNNPADYNIANIPYKPSRHFPISTAGVKEGDFTMVYGFPGRTTQYLSSYQVDQVQNTVDPIRIEARTKKLAVWNEAMRTDKAVFLKYAAKQSSVANGWKKWQGEVLGLEKNNIIAYKQNIEKTFEEKVALNGTAAEKMLLTNIQALVVGNKGLIESEEFTRETVMSIETIQQSQVLAQILNLYRSDLNQQLLADTLQKVKTRLNGFYKNFVPNLDKEVFIALMPYYLQQDNRIVPSQLRKVFYENGNNHQSWANNVYNNGLVANQASLFNLLDRAQKSDSTLLKGDPAYIIYNTVKTHQNEVLNPALKVYNAKMTPIFRQYVKAQMKYNPAKKVLYPDANSTLRLAYGNVSAIAQKEGNYYLTNLDQVIGKNNPSLEEFNIPKKLMDIYQSKDYGRWNVNGTVPVNFIATNHTTGGNSGSPVLNAKGQLIGINFDRIWQGTMSDIHFDENLCRNIAVDVRYVLFILEKYGNAGWLLNEMTLAH